MGLTINRGGRIPRSLHELNQAGNKHHQNQPELDDDVEAEETASITDVEILPSRPLHRKRPLPEPADDTDEVIVTNASRPVKATSHASNHGKVRMTTDISKELHTRLRLHAARTGQNHIQIVECWIAQYCPE